MHAYTLRRLGRPYETVGLSERGRQYVAVFRTAWDAQTFGGWVGTVGRSELWLESVDFGLVQERDVSSDVDLALAARGRRRGGKLADGPVVIRTGVSLCARRSWMDCADSGDAFDVHQVLMDDAMLLPLEKRVGVILPAPCPWPATKSAGKGGPLTSRGAGALLTPHPSDEGEDDSSDDDVLKIDCTVLQAWRTF